MDRNDELKEVIAWVVIDGEGEAAVTGVGKWREL
jgi:hypothetical protein